MGLDVGERRQRIVVRGAGESSSGSAVRSTAEIVAPGNSVAVICRKDGFIGADENVVLD